jgi:hypothetical protein
MMFSRAHNSHRPRISPESATARKALTGLATFALVAGGINVYSQETNNDSSNIGISIEIIDVITKVDQDEKTEPIAPQEFPATPEVTQISTIYIGTYNAWWPKKNSKKTINDVLNLMRGTPDTPAVDVLGVQEFKGDSEYNEFPKLVQLCDTCEFNAYIPDSEARALPIIWKPSRVTDLSTETIFLHSKEEADGANVASRWVNIVLFKDNASGQQFYLANTHFVHGTQDGNELNLDNPKRQKLLDKELGGFVPKTEELKLTGLPVFATYDANMSANSTNRASPKNILKDLGFTDGHDLSVIDNTPQEQGTHRGRDIDYVSLHPGLYAEQARILASWTLGNSLIKLTSDHDAFVTEAALVKKTS